MGAADVARVASNETTGLSQAQPVAAGAEALYCGPQSDRRRFGRGCDSESGRWAAMMGRCPAAYLAQPRRAGTAPSPFPCGFWSRRHDIVVVSFSASRS